MSGMGWTPAIPAPGFTLGYGYGMGYVSHPYEAGGLSWQAGGSSWQAHGGAGLCEPKAYGARGSKHHEPGHSSDSEGMPPPVRPQVTLDVLNTRMGGLELQNRQIQGTLNAHIQTATQWHQQTQQSFIDLEDASRRRHKAQMAYL